MKPISVEPGVYGPNVHVTHQPADPTMLDRPCESCDESGCRAVATVHWVNPSNVAGETRFRAGRRCVATIGDLAEMYPDWPRIDVYVDLPVWRRPEMAAAVGARVSERKIDVWTSERLLVSETGFHPGRGSPRLYLADMVERAHWVDTLTDRARDQISPRAATWLLDFDRDLARRAREAFEASAIGTRTA